MSIPRRWQRLLPVRERDMVDAVVDVTVFELDFRSSTALIRGPCSSREARGHVRPAIFGQNSYHHYGADYELVWEPRYD